MSNCLDCPVYIRGLSVPGADTGPTLLARTDADFIQAFLDELAAGDGLAAVGKSVAKAPEDEAYLKLFPPVQRTFNLAVLETGCDLPAGQPRLDPTRIESAGLVVRRVYEDPKLAGTALQARNGALTTQGKAKTSRARAQAAAESLRSFLEQATNTVTAQTEAVRSARERITGMATPRYEAWARMGSRLQGWVQLADDEIELDPDPERRRPPARSGNAFLDELLAASGQQPRAEAVSPLFVAPPEVCEAAGKTVLYGLIPVTSTEISEAPEELPPFPATAVKAHLSDFLKTGTSPKVPQAGQRVDAAAAKAPDEAMAGFILLLRQLAVELDAFGTSPAATALFAQVNQIKLPFTFTAAEVQALPDNPFGDLVQAHRANAARIQQTAIRIYVPAGDFLRLATPVLVERLAEDPDDGRSLSLIMPDTWPSVTAAQDRAIQSAVTAAMQARLGNLAAKSGRYDELNRLYVTQAFIRVRGKPGCPPTLIWSKPSAPFAIAAWYESGNAAPTQVRLPDVTDREFLKKIKPNVAFVMPEGLFNMLNRNDPKDLQTGSAPNSGSSIGLQWICSFSIPIITICAFIVLYIFLTLFDLIFQWLLWIKICIPFPKKG